MAVDSITTNNGRPRKRKAPLAWMRRSRGGRSSTPSVTRFADRKKRRNRILTGLYLACIVELALLLFASPLMSIRNTRIVGLENDNTLTGPEVEAVKSAVKVRRGANWALAPVYAIHRRIEAMPWILHVDAHRSFPLDVTTNIEVRTPVYSLITSTGNFEMDAGNTPIRPLRSEYQHRLKPISIGYPATLRPGTPVGDMEVKTSSQILIGMKSDPLIRIAKIEIDQTHIIWLNMDNGVRIKFGHCDAVDAKLAMIHRILAADPGHGIRFSEINVSSPDWPAGRLRSDPINATESRSIVPVPSAVHRTATVTSGNEGQPNQQSKSLDR